ncbi:hypothetical protein F2Q68_00030604 [Brassica cretica]|uniref:DUF287 domain-containing protein n=1 Tax=Brassica cretica TaxID=69181 RepID=A0A8S9G602_BRACR|nr:hypothetical protein F2Q68_00030604 [Brassica cretica]
MLARIIDEEREYDRQGSPSDTWNYLLNVKQKNIWWKDLYELDQAARVLPKKKDKEKVTFAEGSSSNSGLDSRLQGLEERILEFMGEGFVGLNLTVETKLEKVMKGNQKEVANQRRRQSLRIIKLDSIAKKPEPVVHKSSKKSSPVREPVRALSVESLSASDESEREGSEREEMQPMQPLEFYFKSNEFPKTCKIQTKCFVINSVLVTTIGEKIMLARIIDEEREYGRQGSLSDTWNYWLNVKQKNIWWKDLYELDQAARVLPKKKDKEKVTFAEGSSSNSGLDSRLQGLEERILEFMREGFVGLNLTVETKLESLGSRMSDIEKNQRLLRRRALRK